MKITPALLYTIAPSAKPEYVDDIVKYWPEFQTQYGLTDADVPHSLAHIAAETGGFNRLEESLFYTTTARLRKVWPSRFKSDRAAAPYVRQPEKLANFVYGGRLGNTGPNDGWLYRGSGAKQTTGKTNYAAVERATGIPAVTHPQLLRAFPVALESALVYWRDTRLSKIVAAGGDVVAKLTKAIQGGTGGLADRRTYTARALNAFAKPSTTILVPPNVAETASNMLRKGSNGNRVIRLQTNLKALGYNPGNIDGIYGDGTEDAVKLFQAQHGLVADGVAGPKTFDMLQFGNAEPARDPALREPSGLDKFIAWIVGLFRK
jgi:predicted chitinase